MKQLLQDYGYQALVTVSALFFLWILISSLARMINHNRRVNRMQKSGGKETVHNDKNDKKELQSQGRH